MLENLIVPVKKSDWNRRAMHLLSLASKAAQLALRKVLNFIQLKTRETIPPASHRSAPALGPSKPQLRYPASINRFSQWVLALAAS
jgi:hypothetical protein